MYCENTSDINREFCNALALLRSTEEDSTEKLRQMLDSCIEKRYGPGSTLITRIPKRFLQDMDDSIVPMGTSTKRLNVRAQDATKHEICHDFQQMVSLSQTNDISDRSTTINMRVLEVGYVNCYDDGDIPRISIPDEGSTDTTVCKVCNGAKLGPLILLECQECQETYHPLCHQPPVVDVDVYDPRFVWRCKRCTETTTETSVKCKPMEKKSVEEIRQNDDTTRENLNIPRLRMNGRTDVDLFGKNDPSEVENRNTQLHDTSLFVKNLTNPSQRKGNFLSATTQSRKRIGSKLIVTRATIK